MTAPHSDIDFGLDLRPVVPILPGEEFHAALGRLRRASRLPTVIFAGGTMRLITRFDDLDAAFRNNEGLPAGPTYAMTIEPCQGVTFESTDGPEHDVLRNLSTRELRAGPVRRFEATELAPLAHAVVDHFAGDGQADLVARFTSVYPFLVLGRRLGLPLDEAHRFKDWAFDILSYPIANDPGLLAAAELDEFVAPLITARRSCPQGDLLSSMVSSERNGRSLDDEEVHSHVKALFSAGATTSMHGLGNALYAVLSNEGLTARLAADPALAAAAVDEMLRWEPPLGVLPRLVTAPVEVAGELVAPGTMLLFGIASANRDETHFDDPDTFRIDRRPERLLTFGFGSHYCPGVHLAKSQIRVGIQVLLERLPGLRLLDDVAARPVGTVIRGPMELRVGW